MGVGWWGGAKGSVSALRLLVGCGRVAPTPNPGGSPGVELPGDCHAPESLASEVAGPLEVRLVCGVPRGLQSDSLGHIAGSVGVPELRNSAVGLQDHLPHACALSTCSESACQATTCGANQHFEELSFRAMPIPDVLPTLCLTYTVLLRCVCLVSPMWIGSTWEALAIHKAYTRQLIANTPGRAPWCCPPHPHPASRQTRKPAAVLTKLGEVAP